MVKTLNWGFLLKKFTNSLNYLQKFCLMHFSYFFTLITNSCIRSLRQGYLTWLRLTQSSRVCIFWSWRDFKQCMDGVLQTEHFPFETFNRQSIKNLNVKSFRIFILAGTKGITRKPQTRKTGSIWCMLFMLEKLTSFWRLEVNKFECGKCHWTTLNQSYRILYENNFLVRRQGWNRLDDGCMKSCQKSKRISWVSYTVMQAFMYSFDFSFESSLKHSGVAWKGENKCSKAKVTSYW